MSKLFNFNLPIVATTAIGAVTILGMYLYRKPKRNSIPTEWKAVGKVKGLYMYPLKSGRRVELKTAHCTGYGIQLKTENGYPLRDSSKLDLKLVLFQGYGMTKRSLALIEAAQWISEYILDKPSGLRLGLHDGLPDHRRNIKETHQKYFKFYPYLESSSTGLYSDLTSYLLINQASLDELSVRIPASNVTVHNFRPNILVEGENLDPYDEDKWDWVKIGDVIWQNVKPCTRCVLTTIDPDTGIKATSGEPLKTLKTYRKSRDVIKIEFGGDDPIMGIHLGLKYDGEIKIGDTVFMGKS
ncbi:hypothetical protein ILUMI_07068 [Ignelater luminosus]|uniref:MOSC domain-containing protein n=1 Tax=Ignelater luminosus TaxID=2038154 RepID=A0A8K0GGN3_IGNLU|nr:hypothetical protein ILUMI_07068 [Ignelater luminosus]